jgi:hypothetical protein
MPPSAGDAQDRQRVVLPEWMILFEKGHFGYAAVPLIDSAGEFKGLFGMSGGTTLREDDGFINASNARLHDAIASRSARMTPPARTVHHKRLCVQISRIPRLVQHGCRR